MGLRESLRWRWRHFLCRIKGHDQKFARRVFKLKNRRGRICVRCGDWIEDAKPKYVGMSLNKEDLDRFRKHFSEEFLDWLSKGKR